VNILSDSTEGMHAGEAVTLPPLISIGKVFGPTNNINKCSWIKLLDYWNC